MAKTKLAVRPKFWGQSTEPREGGQMNFKKAFLIGAVVGALLAVILWPGAPYNGLLFNSMTTPEGSLISAWLCPFSVLMFFMRSMAAIVTIAIIGNTILYGLLAMLCFFLYKAIPWIGAKRKRGRYPF